MSDEKGTCTTSRTNYTQLNYSLRTEEQNRDGDWSVQFYDLLEEPGDKGQDVFLPKSYRIPVDSDRGRGAEGSLHLFSKGMESSRVGRVSHRH